MVVNPMVVNPMAGKPMAGKPMVVDPAIDHHRRWSIRGSTTLRHEREGAR
jgi:hypothetical protein